MTPPTITVGAPRGYDRGMEVRPIDEGRTVIIECARYAAGEITFDQLEAFVGDFDFGPSDEPDFTHGWIDDGYMARFPVPGSIDELIAARTRHYLTSDEGDRLYRLAYDRYMARHQVPSAR